MQADFNFWNTLFDVIVLLGFGMIFGAICVRLRQSPLVGYILAGMLLGGPGSLGLVGSKAEVSSIAELGVSLLLFELGLEFSLKQFRTLGMRVILGGAAQVVITAAAGAGAYYFYSGRLGESAVFGLLVAFSSTAAVVRMLTDYRELESLHGRTAVGVLLVQDAAVVPAALMIALLGGGGGAGALGEELLRVGVLVAIFLVGLYVIVSKTAVSFLRALHLEQSRELAVLLAVTTGLGSAWAAHAAGLSPALGAFAAGLLLAETPFAVQIRADVAPLQVVLLTLFFGSVGMLADFSWIVAHWQAVLGLALVLLAGKTLLTWVSLAAAGVHAGTSLGAALVVSQVGEFSFVLGKSAQQAGLASAEMFSLVLSAGVVLLLLTPLLVAGAAGLSARVSGMRRQGRDHAEGGGGPPAVIVGFGPAGQAVAKELLGRKVAACVIDLNQDSLSQAGKLGLHTLLGDARQREVLQAAGAARACLVAVTVPAPRVALRIVEQVRLLAPHAFVFVRSRDRRYNEALRAAGVYTLVDEEAAAGEKLVAAVAAVLPAAEPESRS